MLMRRTFSGGQCAHSLSAVQGKANSMHTYTQSLLALETQPLSHHEGPSHHDRSAVHDCEFLHESLYSDTAPYAPS